MWRAWKKSGVAERLGSVSGTGREHVDEPGGRWPTAGITEVGNRRFVLADADGYLWRPFQDLGERHPPS